MSNCNEYIELISAYADGELPESNKQKLEEHLLTCKSCSSILDLYRGITLAVEESCVPAPDAICSGVMEKITSVTTEQNAAKMKKFKTVNIILTRYLPAAACLAFILLTVPRLFGNNGSYSRSENGVALMEAAMPGAADTGAQVSAGGGGLISGNAEVAVDENSEVYAMDINPSASSSMSGAAQAPAAPPTVVTEELETTAAAPVVQPDAPETEMILPADAMSDDMDAVENDLAFDEFGGDSSGSGRDGIVEDEELSAADLPPAETSTAQTEPEEETEESPGNYLQDVYATIIINGSILKGNMPALFEQYMPEDFDIEEIGYMSFEIPREQAIMLISYISDLDGVVVNMADENGTHAMVYYIP